MGAVISFLVIAIVVLLILSSCIRIVPQAQALVVERLGAYLETCRLACISRCRSLTAWQKSHFKRAGCRFCTAAGYHER